MGQVQDKLITLLQPNMDTLSAIEEANRMIHDVATSGKPAHYTLPDGTRFILKLKKEAQHGSRY
jgi:hypothetical protein